MFTSPAAGFLCMIFYFLTLFGGSLGQNGANVVKVSVREDDTAVLPCSISTKENIVAAVFDWKKDASRSEKEVFFYQSGLHYSNGRPGQDEQFKGRVSHFQDELKNGNASIKIQNTKIEDSGNYTCIFPNLQPREIFHIQLFVEQVFKDRSGKRNGAAQPDIDVLAATKDRSLLQCEAHGVAPLTVEWQNSAKNKLQAEEPEISERGGQLDITVRITVTKTDNYTCVATQENISHQKVATIPVYIQEDEDVSEDVSTRVIIGFGGLFIGAAAVVLAEMILIATKRIKITFNNKAGLCRLGKDVESSTEKPLNSAL